MPDNPTKDRDDADEREAARDEDEAQPEGRDEAAERMARALRVEEDEDASAASDAAADEQAAANRAARRREQAMERRRKRRAGAAGARADEELPKDKNARARELLQRRREQASDRGRKVSSALLPEEMMGDALARTVAATTKWFRRNWPVLQWVIVVAVVGGGGFLFYQHRTEKKSANASDELSTAVSADRGFVVPEDKRSDEEKQVDQTRVFKTADEKTETVLAAYKKAADDNPGTGAAILAKLGEGGALLDKRDYDGALAAYQAVLSSPLAGADADVKGRALEGTGFAKEGKGDLDGALSTFRQLEGLDAKGYKELGEYHEARVFLAKGETDKAKELLKAAHEKLSAPTTEGTNLFPFLQALVDETLRKLDPSAVPPRADLSTGAKGSMSPEELQKRLRRAMEAAGQKGP